MWTAISDPTWTRIQGPDVVDVAFQSGLVPRPVSGLPETWLAPTCLVPRTLVRAAREGIEVRLEQPWSGLEVVTSRLGGKVLCPVVPETAPDRVREGVLRLRVTAQGSPCPCGAATTVDAVGRSVVTRHGDGCPAEESALRRAAIAWLGV